MTSVSVKSLEVRYPERTSPALAGIDLEIGAGELAVLCGPSGCGKSTLTRVLNGIIPNLVPADVFGEIKINGANLRGLSSQAISERVGSVFQDPRTQFFHVNVLDEIAFGPENMGLSPTEIRRRVDDAVDLLDLSHLTGKRMFDLSSGERQKIIFAAVHAMAPDILVLDEPSANLDTLAIRELSNILRRLKEAGRAVLIAEHRLHYLTGLYDRLVIMEAGRISLELSGDERLTLGLRRRHGLRSQDPPSLERLWLKGFGTIESPETHGAPDHFGAPRAPGHLSPSTDDSQVLLARPVGNNPKPASSSKNLCQPIVIEELSFRYHSTLLPALFGVNARLDPGGLAAIVGPNGSGKTTLIKLLGGLLREGGGRIEVGGRKLSARQRIQQCGFVMQEYGNQLFFPSVRLELASGFSRPPSDDELNKILDELNLADLAKVHPRTLSGGQKQRLVIAVALASNPALLILDEPTSGLDAGHMLRLSDTLHHGTAQGMAVVVVTHDFEFIEQSCQRLLSLSKGRLISDSPVPLPSQEMICL